MNKIIFPLVLLFIPFSVLADDQEIIGVNNAQINGMPIHVDCSGFEYALDSCRGVEIANNHLNYIQNDTEIIKAQNAKIIDQNLQIIELLKIQNCYTLYKNTYEGNSWSYSDQQSPDDLVKKCGSFP